MTNKQMVTLEIDGMTLDKLAQWIIENVLQPALGIEIENDYYHHDDLTIAFMVAEIIHNKILSTDELGKSLNYLTLAALGVSEGWAATFNSIGYSPEDSEWYERSMIAKYPASARAKEPAEAIERAAAKAWVILDGQTKV